MKITFHYLFSGIFSLYLFWICSKRLLLTFYTYSFIWLTYYIHIVVYRGCADQYKLPINVDPYKNCQYQAGSLWYFCDGDLCNKQQIGKECSYKPTYPTTKAYKGSKLLQYFNSTNNKSKDRYIGKNFKCLIRNEWL